jgi:hypothetical protein
MDVFGLFRSAFLAGCGHKGIIRIANPRGVRKQAAAIGLVASKTIE